MKSHGIPHAFMLKGKRWRVRWGDSKDEGWDAKSDWGQMIRSERLIVLNPVLRKTENRVLAISTFVHELLHIVTPKVSHRMVHRLDDPLGQAFVDMGVQFPCVCKPCQKAKRA